jgi:hypothetical protein
MRLAMDAKQKLQQIAAKSLGGKPEITRSPANASSAKAAAQG